MKPGGMAVDEEKVTGIAAAVEKGQFEKGHVILKRVKGVP